MPAEGSAPPSLRVCRIEEPTHCSDAIRRKPCAPGVFLNGCLVRSEVDAVHFVAGHVAMQPLDLWTHSLQSVDRPLGDFPPLVVGQICGSRDFAFDDELRHEYSPTCTDASMGERADSRRVTK